MPSDIPIKDKRSYSVYGLLVAGSRFTGDYDEAAAIEDYLELHPQADRTTVERELREEIERRGG